MLIFDLLEIDPNQLSLFLKRWNIIIPVEFIQLVIDIIIWIFVITSAGASALYCITKIWNLLPCSKKRKRSDYIHHNLDHDFKEYLGKKNQGQYIETHFVSCPPHEYDEPNKVTTASTRESMTSFCERIFNEENPNERLYMVLAGSGMGKTTFMVNLFCYYVKKNMTYTGLPFDIRLLRLDDEDFLNKINEIKREPNLNVNKTILLLDALDENRSASEDFCKFQEELEKAMEPFKLVMITCRSQFFDSEKMIPEETSWVSTGRDKNLINYNKVYISPFSEADIKRYLSIKYKGQRKKKKRAQLIVEKCKNLMVRPLLLSYIDDLIEEDVACTELSDIYITLIDKWLQREVNSIQDKDERIKRKENLYNFSTDIAKTIYSNWMEEKSMQLTPLQMKSFMTKYKYEDVPFDLKRRSLINRNASGSYKFAHKSFLEYFLAVEFFKNPSFELEFEGMDIAKKIYKELCVTEFKSQQKDKVFEIITYMRYNSILRINKVSNINYIHIYEALCAFDIKLKEVSFCWDSYTEDLHNFLIKAKVSLINIRDYKKMIEISPKILLKISTLSCIEFEGEEDSKLPKSFINSARKFGVTTIYNKEFITYGTTFIHLPMLYNVDFQQKKRLIYINNDLKDNNTLIEHVYSTINKN